MKNKLMKNQLKTPEFGQIYQIEYTVDKKYNQRGVCCGLEFDDNNKPTLIKMALENYKYDEFLWFSIKDGYAYSQGRIGKDYQLDYKIIY